MLLLLAGATGCSDGRTHGTDLPRATRSAHASASAPLVRQPARAPGVRVRLRDPAATASPARPAPSAYVPSSTAARSSATPTVSRRRPTSVAPPSSSTASGRSSSSPSSGGRASTPGAGNSTRVSGPARQAWTARRLAERLEPPRRRPRPRTRSRSSTLAGGTSHPRGPLVDRPRPQAAGSCRSRSTTSELPLPYVIDPAVTHRATTVSNNGAAGAANITLTYPAGVAANDLLIATIAVRGGARRTTPSGWAAGRSSQNGANVRLVTFYKVATASEPASQLVRLGRARDRPSARSAPTTASRRASATRTSSMS